MKGNFWRKIFRNGYNAHGYHSPQYNGKMAKTDAKSSRARLHRIGFNICGDVYYHYIKEIKEHWWSRWRIVMDGYAPMMFDKQGNVKL